MFKRNKSTLLFENLKNLELSDEGPKVQKILILSIFFFTVQ